MGNCFLMGIKFVLQGKSSLDCTSVWIYLKLQRKKKHVSSEKSMKPEEKTSNSGKIRECHS